MKALVSCSRLPVYRPRPAARAQRAPLEWIVLLGVLGCTLGSTLGCNDPVEDTPPEGTPSATPARPERPRASASGTEDEGGETTRERRGDPADTPETVAADVAAGLTDGGVADDPRAQAAPDPSVDAVAAPPPSEPSEYIRPEIQDDFLEGVRILRFALAEDVIEREPVMISSRFRHNSGPMHVFLEVANQTADDVTLLVGFRRASDQRRGGGVALTVPPSPRYRTRARANTRRAPGEWVCEVMDDRQRVLVTQRFFIVPDPSAAAPSAGE